MINFKYANKFCRDDLSKIENYEQAIADKTQTWHLHHRLELTLDGEFALSRDQLKMHDMYYNRPYYELTLLTPKEHMRLHNTGKQLSDETRKKISEAEKGDNHPFFGKHHSDETKKKISESNKGKPGFWKGKHRSDETCRKISNANKGKFHSDETRRKMSESAKHRSPISEETRKKMSEAKKNMTDETRRKIGEASRRRWEKRRKNLHG